MGAAPTRVFVFPPTRIWPLSQPLRHRPTAALQRAIMAATDLVLRFVYPDNANADFRTVNIHQAVEGSDTLIELYKVCPRALSPGSLSGTDRPCAQFHHPNTGVNTGLTTFQRKNFETQLWENAGQIEWNSNTSGAVYFGVERVRPSHRLSTMTC